MADDKLHLTQTLDHGIAGTRSDPQPGFAATVDTTQNDSPARDIPTAVSAADRHRQPAKRPASSSTGGLGRLPMPGEQIEKYQIIRELGRGGMGAVFLARDIRLARRVAIKFLISHRAELTERFQVEARTTARCKHENIVVIHDVSEYQGNPFMVLEYLEGRSLKQHMDQIKTLSARQALEIMVPVARALVAAHAQGIVHRDLKPDNIFLERTGTIKVLDFGIAKILSENKPRPAKASPGTTLPMSAPGPASPLLTTEPGMLMGTLPYMSPEQWGAATVDHRTDIWAMGIILHELLVGRHPLFPYTQQSLMVTGLVDQPMPSIHDAGPGVPRILGDIVDACLVKSKSRRIGDASELLEKLEALLPRRQRHQLTADESPYPGLMAFQETDADRYFGRSRDLTEALTRLRKQALLGITGPTGVGKSSFLRAGVIAALRAADEAWEVFVVRPGRAPLSALASMALPLTREDDEATSVNGSVAAPKTGSSGAEDVASHRALVERVRTEPGYLGTLLRTRAQRRGTHILVVIDPFEELYTLTDDLAERQAFTRCLAGMSDDVGAPLRVLISMRSDFLDRVAEDRQFMTELAGNLVFLSPPDRAGLEEALIRPAEMAGYRFEAEHMITELIAEVEVTANPLPLLQFVARKLWDERDTEDKLLTVASYRAMGGLVGAVTGHADAVVSEIAKLSPRAEQMTKNIFQRLVTEQRTRAIATMSELRELADDADTIQSIIDRLVAARLLVVQTGDGPSGPTVEIIHDSLIKNWPRLRRWLDEDENHAVYLAQLGVAARQWADKNRNPGLLWRGDALAEARQFRARFTGTLKELHAEYLDAAFAAERRSRRRKTALVVGTMVFLFAVAVASVIAAVTIRSARQEAAQQQSEAAQAKAEVASASAKLDRAESRAKETGAKLSLTKEQLVDALQRAEETSRVARQAEQEALAAKVRAEAESERAQAAEKVALGEKARAQAASAQARQAADALQELVERETRLRKETETLLSAEKKRTARFEKEFGSREQKGLR